MLWDLQYRLSRDPSFIVLPLRKGVSNHWLSVIALVSKSYFTKNTGYDKNRCLRKRTNFCPVLHTELQCTRSEIIFQTVLVWDICGACRQSRQMWHQMRTFKRLNWTIRYTFLTETSYAHVEQNAWYIAHAVIRFAIYFLDDENDMSPNRLYAEALESWVKRLNHLASMKM